MLLARLTTILSTAIDYPGAGDPVLHAEALELWAARLRGRGVVGEA